MIFFTVGTQLPFDRVAKTLDKWLLNHKNNNEIYGQLGNNQYKPIHYNWTQYLSRDAFKDTISRCSLIISHAGIGSILSAIEFNKPIIIVPRIAALGEHRNDHQLDTINQFKKLQLVNIAQDTDELLELLSDSDQLTMSSDTKSKSREQLINTVRQFISNERI